MKSDHPDRSGKTSKQLIHLSQGSLNVPDFSMDFHTLAVDSSWNNAPLLGVFLVKYFLSEHVVILSHIYSKHTSVQCTSI